MSSHAIRIYGDPVLRTRSADVTEIDGRLHTLSESMFDTMYEAPGLGLAAPQIGVRKRFFVYDFGDGPQTMINPEILESEGEWIYEEGCLSVPGLSWEITRPKTIHIVGLDIDGNEISIEADELEARLYQHEIDHLDGILLVDHLDDEQRREALSVIRELGMGEPNRKPVAKAGGLQLP
jgi:peptide deformylase